MSPSTAPDPYAPPAAASRATRPRTAAPSSPPAAVAAAGASGAASPPAGEDPRGLLLRLLPQTQVLAALGATDADYAAWSTVGRAWRTYQRPDGILLADPIDVLAVLAAPGGAA